MKKAENKPSMPSVLLSWLKIEAEEIEEGRGIERIGVDREDGGEETTNLTPSKVGKQGITG